MKTTKLIDRIQKLLKRPPEETELKKLCKTIRALKEKQKELEERLKQTSGRHARERIEQKIDVLRSQRHKGVHVYRELKAAAKH